MIDFEMLRTMRDKSISVTDDFTDEEYAQEWKDRGDERKHPDERG